MDCANTASLDYIETTHWRYDNDAGHQGLGDGDQGLDDACHQGLDDAGHSLSLLVAGVVCRQCRPGHETTQQRPVLGSTLINHE